MEQLVIVGNQEIAVKEINGQRVVTFKDIDLLHERADGTAGRNFRENKDRFIEGEDYFQRNSSEAKSQYGITAPNGLILVTEQGYLMLVKSFTDDLAWKVQRQLVNTYFKVKKPLSQIEILQQSVEMLKEHDHRLDKLEDTMTIDYGQQKTLERLVNETVVRHLGGKSSAAYKEINKKVFSECNRDIKDRFNVNSRSNVPRMRFEDACSYIRRWEPSTNTKIDIEDRNKQLCLA